MTTIHASPAPAAGPASLLMSPGRYTPSLVSATSTDTDGRYDVMHELREATASPTPLGEFLRDPAVLTTLLGHKKPRRGSTSSSHRERLREHSRERSREREHGSKDARREKKSKDTSDTSSILTLVLAEEERQAHRLKAVLRSTGERLDYEMRRADVAEQRARAAEGHGREMQLRVAAAESGKHQAELDSARTREETKRYQIVAETAERELRRVQADMRRLEQLRQEAEDKASEARDLARKAQQTLREFQARQEGREEGRRLEATRRYNDGREDGFEDGRAEGFEQGHAEGFEEGRAEGYSAGRSEGYNAGRLIGFEEGKKVGWDDGYDEGLQKGRRQEREHALDAFDKFMESEVGRESMRESMITMTTEDGDERTQRWIQATQNREPSPLPLPLRVPSPANDRTASPQPVRVPSPAPAPIPSPQPVHAVPPPAPNPVWLHRRVNPVPDANANPPRIYA